MSTADTPQNTTLHMEAVGRYNRTDHALELALDELTVLATHLCDTPMALISLVAPIDHLATDDFDLEITGSDFGRQRVLATVGLSGRNSSKIAALCHATAQRREALLVEDTNQDPRFSDSRPSDAELGVRFYAGVPLSTPEGFALGTLSVLDRVPRTLTTAQRSSLDSLARQVMAHLELSRQASALEEREKRLRLALDAAHMGTFHWDAQRNSLTWDRRLEALWGFEPGDFDGSHVSLTARVHPDDLPRVAAHVQRLVAEREPFDLEFRVVWPDGSVHWLQSLGEFTVAADSHAPRMRGVVREITEQKTAEEALRHHEMILRETGRIAKVGGWEFDPRSGDGSWTEEVALIHGVLPGEPINLEQAMSYYHADSRARAAAAVRQAMQAGTPYDLELELVTAGQRRRWVRTIGRPVLENGKVIKIRGSTQDVTEAKRARQRLEQLNRVHALLSGINQAITREKDVQELLLEVCRIAVEVGDFRIAWIGLVDPDQGVLGTSAHAGAASEMLRFADDLRSDPPVPARCGFTRYALQTGQAGVCNKVETAPRSTSWLEQARDVGVGAMAALPLRSGERVVGTFNLYAAEAGFFDRSELELLDRMAADISFALDVMQRDEQRRATESRLAEQRNALLELAGERRLTADLDTSLLTVAEVVGRTLGVDLVGILRFDQACSRLECVAGLEISSGRRVTSPDLTAADHPRYIDTLLEGEVVAAEDAVRDPRTRSLEEQLLTPLGIGTLLSVPVLIGGKPVGALSLAQRGTRYQWRSDEITFAMAMANVVSLAIEGWERRRAEQAFTESEERFREIAEAVEDIVFIFDPVEHRLLYVSPAYEAIAGRPREPLYRNSDQWLEMIHPEDRERIARRRDTARSRRSGRFDQEYRIVRPDGEIRWLHTRNLTVRSENDPVRIIGLASDVTERKLAELETQRLNRRHKALIENSADGIALLDADWNVVYASPSATRLNGFTVEDLEGRNVLGEIHTEDVPVVTAALHDAMAAPLATVETRCRRRHKDGRWLWIEARITNLLHDPSVGALVVNYRDVTTRMRLANELRQAQKMEAIGQLAGGIAHDFSNIIAAIILQTDVISHVENTPEEVLAGLREIHTASELATDLTRQLLTFGRRQAMWPRVLDLNQVVTGFAKMLRRLLGEKVELELQLDRLALPTFADEAMLDQVLLNLVVNARDAMPEGGQVSISTGETTITATDLASKPELTDGRHVVLRVSDTGTGIPPEHLTQMFEPFFTTKDPDKGTGLGLATVFGIVQQHHGSIGVESHVGSGTTFEILLPRSDDDRSATTAEDEQGEALESGSETILLVEDAPEVRFLTRLMLERQGYRVFDAEHSLDAEAVFGEHGEEIDLLLTDVVMPQGVSGLRLAKALRASKPELPVIYTSGYSAEIAARELALGERDAFLQKPASPDQLLRTVRESLDG